MIIGENMVSLTCSETDENKLVKVETSSVLWVWIRWLPVQPDRYIFVQYLAIWLFAYTNKIVAQKQKIQ